MMKKGYEGHVHSGYISAEKMLSELEKDLSARHIPLAPAEAPSGKKAILEILGRAADDHKFLAKLAENPNEALKDYELTWEERVALKSGDLRRIEAWVGKLDQRLGTWIWCRLQMEKW
jgi:hypothetical protein